MAVILRSTEMGGSDFQVFTPAAMKLTALLVLFSVNLWTASADFYIQSHLSSSTPYEASLREHGGVPPSLPAAPPGCVAVHLNLVARHGTRGPTPRRIGQLNRLAAKLRAEAARVGPEGAAASGPTPPSWMREYRSPWEGREMGGELVAAGEEELFALGRRLRQRFPELLDREYHPSRYPILATQVPRASASAVAFGLGLFHGNGTLGGCGSRAFAVVTESKAKDVQLRFHDNCGAYTVYKKRHEPAVDRHLEEVHSFIAPRLVERYSLNLTGEDVGSLWLLCKQEAAVLGETDRACRLFSEREVLVLEWADDVAIHHLKGYGESVNYRMGVPLLADVVESMEAAVAEVRWLEGEGGTKGGRKDPTQLARLRFAHAETVIPFTCLLGLFQEEEGKAAADATRLAKQKHEMAKKKREKLGAAERVVLEMPLPAPPMPPEPRAWRASQVAPFSANTALVLYQCPAPGRGSEFRVLAMHNERAVAMPACGGELFCPYPVFKEHVVEPHLQHTFEATCAAPEPSPFEDKAWPRRFGHFLYHWFLRHWVFLWNLLISYQGVPSSRELTANEL